jgi:hypothetical protein
VIVYKGVFMNFFEIAFLEIMVPFRLSYYLMRRARVGTDMDHEEARTALNVILQQICWI